MFRASVEKYGDLSALPTKKNDTWEKITFEEYYQVLVLNYFDIYTKH